MPEKDNLSKQDLYILMESYKNNIQLNTTLLEQQKQLIILNDQSMNKQQELCNDIDKLIEKVTTCLEIIQTNQTKLEENQEKLKENQEKLNLDIISFSSNSKLEHGKIVNRIYLALGGMVTIIISVIGLAATYSDKIAAVANIINNHIKGIH
jgi:hypothetical protein